MNKVMENYIKEVIFEDIAARTSFAGDIGKNSNWNPYFKVQHSYDPEEQKRSYIDMMRTGRSVKQVYTKYADRTFLNSLITVHWSNPASIIRLLKGYKVSNFSKDELSTNAYLPSESIGNFGPMSDAYGLVIKGYITLLANDMNDVISGSGELYKKADPNRTKMSGANKGLGVTWEPESYKDDPIFVFDKEDWKPSESGKEGIVFRSNEAFVDNWKPIGILVPKRNVGKFEHIVEELGLDVYVKGTI